MNIKTSEKIVADVLFPRICGKKPYVCPVIESIPVNVECSLLAASPDVKTSVEVEELEDGGTEELIMYEEQGVGI